jgi:hypothetical protein
VVSPAGMIFVPSVKGISHSPKEITLAEDMANDEYLPSIQMSDQSYA